jgi:hypothetical protein
MDTFDLTTTRTQPLTLSGVNSYILTDFEERIRKIVKELEILKACKNKSARRGIIERISALYKGETI